MRLVLTARFAVAVAVATSSTTFAKPPSKPSAPTASAMAALLAARPYYARTPSGYRADRPAPLLLVLHPYAPGGGRDAVDRFGLAALADQHGLLLAAPDGLLESDQPGAPRFWNASEGCCDFKGHKPDDVAYLSAVITDMKSRYAVDGKRVYAIGYSNGGYMTHRLLCERAELFAGGASLAGAAQKDAARCRPAVPAALLEVHGDADERVSITGSAHDAAAADAIAAWATKLGCAKLVRRPPLDLVEGLPGAETDVTRYACARGAAELWTIRGGTHRTPGAALPAALLFLLSPHPR